MNANHVSWKLVTAVVALLITNPAESAERCAVSNAVKRCVSSFGPGTTTTFGNEAGDINRLIIDVPDTSIDAEKFALVFLLALARLAPRLTPDQRGEALQKLMVLGASNSKESIRLGDWNWTSEWKDKHMTLTARKRK